jgi:hypothetical protein
MTWDGLVHVHCVEPARAGTRSPFPLSGLEGEVIDNGAAMAFVAIRGAAAGVDLATGTVR